MEARQRMADTAGSRPGGGGPLTCPRSGQLEEGARRERGELRLPAACTRLSAARRPHGASAVTSPARRQLASGISMAKPVRGLCGAEQPQREDRSADRVPRPHRLLYGWFGGPWLALAFRKSKTRCDAVDVCRRPGPLRVDPRPLNPSPPRRPCPRTPQRTAACISYPRGP